ncbi:MAG TPA: hypothetical protein VIG06_31080 [Kofleriaceae bacterium]|jgi:hypothetical protein
MKIGPVAHGALTLAALGFAYQTWTREKTEPPKAGEVTVWNESTGDFESFAYDAENKSVRVEKRAEGGNTFYWGSVTTSKKPPKPKVPVKGDEPPKEGEEPGGHGMPGRPGGPGGPGGPGAKPGEKPAAPGAKPATTPAKPGEKTKPATTAPAKPASTTPAKPAPAKPAPAKPATPAPKKPAAGGAPKGPGSPHHMQASEPGATDEPVDTPDEPGMDTPDSSASTPAGAAEEMVTTTREFPVGRAGRELVSSLAHLRALRDLGKLSDQQKEEYGLTDSKENLTVFFKGGKQYSLIVGERVFGGSDRYVLQADTGKGYVLSHSEILRHIDGAETSLGLKDLHKFQEDADEDKDKPKTPNEPNAPRPKKDRYPGVQSILVEGGKDSRELVRADSTDPKGVVALGWSGKDKPGQADLSLSNFLSQVDRLKPTEYDPAVTEASLEKVLTVKYRAGGDKVLGQFELYKKNLVTPEIKPDTPDGEDKKPDDKVEYYVKTELTRIPGKVSRMAAERVEQDIPQLFGGGEIKDETRVPVGPSKPRPGGPVPGRSGSPAPGGAAPPHGVVPGGPKPPTGAAPGGAKAPTGASAKPGSGSSAAPSAPKAPASKPAGSPSSGSKGNK